MRSEQYAAPQAYSHGHVLPFLATSLHKCLRASIYIFVHLPSELKSVSLNHLFIWEVNTSRNINYTFYINVFKEFCLSLEDDKVMDEYQEKKRSQPCCLFLQSEKFRQDVLAQPLHLLHPSLLTTK